MTERMTAEATAEVVAELRRRANELRKIAERPTAPQNQLRWRADALTDAADLVEQHLTPQVLDKPDGPITAEWLESIGFSSRNGKRWGIEASEGDEIEVAIVDDGGAAVSVNGRRVGVSRAGRGWRPYGRAQLFALLAALRGEPSGNPGQLPAVGPQRAAPSSPAKIEAETRAVRGRLDGT